MISEWYTGNVKSNFNGFVTMEIFPDMGSSRHRRFIIVSGQEANGNTIFDLITALCA